MNKLKSTRFFKKSADLVSSTSAADSFCELNPWGPEKIYGHEIA